MYGNLLAGLWLFVLGTMPLVASAEEAQDPIRKAITDGRLSESRKLLEGSGHGRAEAERLELLTEICNAQNDYAAGIRYGRQSIAESPDSSNAHYQYAIAIRNKMYAGGRMKAMLAMGSYKKALRRALELDAENTEALQERIRFLIKAPGIAGGDPKRARELIAQLKALNKVRGLEMEALLEQSSGDPTQALRLLSEAVLEEPENLKLRNQYAVELQRQERYRDADTEFQRIMTAENGTRLAHLALYQRARNRILGRFEQELALEMLEQYLAAVPEDRPGLPTRSNAHWRRGLAHEQLGQMAEARAAYSQALRLNPKNTQAKKSLKALRR